MTWIPEGPMCIDFASPAKYAIAKPCVLIINGQVVMCYSYRGDFYRPGLAVSSDGRSWTRRDQRVGIELSPSGWDSDMLCYPFVLEHGEHFFMFYNGNGYGASGLGFARIEKARLLRIIYD